MSLSVIVPAYNARRTLPGLLDSLKEQNFNDYEAMIVDDCSMDGTSEVLESYDFHHIKLSKNRGPAFCRNLGAKETKGEILVFTDSDCRADRDWLKNINAHFHDDKPDALMGRLVIAPSNILGDSISALGFPAGGSIGFERIWPVDKQGYTKSLSSCNCAIKRDAFERVGGFDESFPYAGGEDSLLAYSLVQSGHTIRYYSDALVYHEARNSLRGFLRWQFRRGVSSYIFASKIKDRKDFMSMRIWSTMNIIKYNLKDKKIPLIYSLLLLNIFMQAAGFLYAKSRDGE